MAFLGVASLAGVIVSHVIVLFDYIEEACDRGEPRQAFLMRESCGRTHQKISATPAVSRGCGL